MLEDFELQPLVISELVINQVMLLQAKLLSEIFTSELVVILVHLVAQTWALLEREQVILVVVLVDGTFALEQEYFG